MKGEVGRWGHWQEADASQKGKCGPGPAPSRKAALAVVGLGMCHDWGDCGHPSSGSPEANGVKCSPEKARAPLQALCNVAGCTY